MSDAAARETAALEPARPGDRAGVRIGRSAHRGRGLFAERDYAAGEIIGRFALLMLPAAEVERLKGTRVYDYVFYVRDAGDDPDYVDAALALGEISLCNHESPASGAFEVDADAEVVVLSAARRIAEGEEITIDYGDFVHFEVRR